ncbi:BRICHOS domain-containing protein [Caerostris extrusa]|uniref:BRICHOS domain-containing protein n=1 Tax=Caerostris extrusa TaxID=172846 RepID=A0AAV4UE51_CAEEX|nr:BRICHOS domain-containing protein [Caerostris extrusa]
MCITLKAVAYISDSQTKTFVVRYKVGEQTIPVTVVLDYKKQTEYVINMSPRATTKTVTLYDFKQKTIAYKDLTNRECFLGHLTHETLNEETDALSRIQNPVEHQPKILSLDPHRSSLTPTEIRNMAGQKTAVFCRKNEHVACIQKREAEEIDERTYHRHGYHTIRYSHYGHETRRRFRNPYRNTTRHLSQRRGNASEINNSKIENSVTSLPFEDNPFPSQSLTVQQQFPRPEHLRANFNGNSLSTHPNSNYQTPPEADVKAAPPPVPSYYRPSLETNLNHENYSSTFPPNYLSRQNEYDSSTFPPNYLSRQNGYDSQIPFDSRFRAIQENQDNRIQDNTHIKKKHPIILQETIFPNLMTLPH